MVFKGALIVQEGTFIYSYIQTCFGLYTDLYSSILQSEFESQIQAHTGTHFGFHLGKNSEFASDIHNSSSRYVYIDVFSMCMIVDIHLYE